MSTPHRHGTHPYNIDELAHTWNQLQSDPSRGADFDAFTDEMSQLPDDVYRALMTRLDELYPIPPLARHRDPFRMLAFYRSGQCPEEATDDQYVFLAQITASTCAYGGCPVCLEFLQQNPPPDYMEQQPAR